MNKNFKEENWQKYLPMPILKEHPEYTSFYKRAWELAHDHVRDIEGMPQNPYMDEAFCDTQVWIWDTCFMSLFCKFAQEVFPGIESFNNFYEVLYGGKLLPKIIPTEKEPKWTGATPGVANNIYVHIADNPPLFAWAEYENALIHGDIEYVKNLLYNTKILQRHYEWIESLRESVHIPGVFLKTNLTNNDIGYTWEGAKSGMDNTPRGRACVPSKERPNNPDMLWIDAICQQALSARAISKLFDIVGDTDGASEWNARYEEKKDIINKLYWNDEDGFYYDIDRRDRHHLKVMTAATFWALTAEIADADKAEAIAEKIRDPETFGGDVPLVSLARNDAEFSSTGKYWRGALWLPTAYAALRGLTAYGYHDIAREAAKKIVSHMERTYTEYEPHTIWEAYAPDYAKPATTVGDNKNVRPDFCGWSALGPISIYLEYVLGFHTVNAFTKTVEWAKPEDTDGEIGIENLRFGEIVTDIVANGNVCEVTSNLPYTLKINGVDYKIETGRQSFVI